MSHTGKSCFTAVVIIAICAIAASSHARYRTSSWDIKASGLSKKTYEDLKRGFRIVRVTRDPKDPSNASVVLSVPRKLVKDVADRGWFNLYDQPGRPKYQGELTPKGRGGRIEVTVNLGPKVSSFYEGTSSAKDRGPHGLASFSINLIGTKGRTGYMPGNTVGLNIPLPKSDRELASYVKDKLLLQHSLLTHGLLKENGGK